MSDFVDRLTTEPALKAVRRTLERHMANTTVGFAGLNSEAIDALKEALATLGIPSSEVTVNEPTNDSYTSKDGSVTLHGASAIKLAQELIAIHAELRQPGINTETGQVGKDEYDAIDGGYRIKVKTFKSTTHSDFPREKRMAITLLEQSPAAVNDFMRKVTTYLGESTPGNILKEIKQNRALCITLGTTRNDAMYNKEDIDRTFGKLANAKIILGEATKQDIHAVTAKRKYMDDPGRHATSSAPMGARFRVGHHVGPPKTGGIF